MKKKGATPLNTLRNWASQSFFFVLKSVQKKITDVVTNFQAYLLRLHLSNLYHTCREAHLIDHYANCAINNDYVSLRKKKWLRTPKKYCEVAYSMLNAEFYKIIHNKEYEKISTSIDEYNLLTNKITKILACAFQLSIKESELARKVLLSLGIGGEKREDVIKRAESTIKMLELRSSNLLSELDNKKKQETTEKQELIDFYNNIASLDKLGFSISKDCTMLEYASKRRMAKEYVDKQIKTNG